MSEQFISARELLKRVRTRTFDYAAGVRKIAEERTGKPVACAKGCAHCCYAKLIVDGGTGAVIALELIAQGRWTKQMRERLAERDAAMSSHSHADWFDRREPCVFLDEDEWGRGTCTIHAVRPYSCVATFSNGPPELCSIGGGRSQFQIEDLDLTRNLLGYQEAILNEAGEDRLWLMTLPGAVLYGFSLLTKEEPPASVVRVDRGTVPRESDSPGMDLVKWIDAKHAEARPPREPILLGPVQHG